MSQKDVDWRCPSGNHHSHCNWAIYALLLLWYWYGYIVPDKTRPTKLSIDLKDIIRYSQWECYPISWSRVLPLLVQRIQSTSGETPGFLTHRHFPELPMCLELSVTLAMNMHTLIVDFFHSHSFFWIFALQCIIFDKKFLWVHFSMDESSCICFYSWAKDFCHEKLITTSNAPHRGRCPPSTKMN